MLCMNPLDFTLVMVSPVICQPCVSVDEQSLMHRSSYVCSLLVYLLVLWIQLSDAELRALKLSVSILRKPLSINLMYSGFDVSLSQYDLAVAACPGRTPCFVL